MEKQAIQRIVSELKFKVRDGLFVSTKDVENYITVIDSLVKQIPKKPLETDYDYGYFICSSCSNSIGFNDSASDHKYCLNCGQKLEWE